MYTKGHYARRKIGGAISNVIYRILMFIVGICLLGVVVWGVMRCMNMVDSEITDRQYKP